MQNQNKERYLVVKVEPVDDTDYETRYVMGETIHEADTVELSSKEVEIIEADKYRYRSVHFRCLRVIDPQAVKELIQKSVANARAEAKKAAEAEAKKEEEKKKRAATLARRRIEQAKKILAEAENAQTDS